MFRDRVSSRAMNKPPRHTRKQPRLKSCRGSRDLSWGGCRYPVLFFLHPFRVSHYCSCPRCTSAVQRRASNTCSARPVHIVSASRKGKGGPYSMTERRVPELIPVFGSQPAGDVSHKSGGKLPLLSARPAVTPATLKRAATNFDAW